MTTYVALLRAINVGGHQPVAMSQLRSLIKDLGFDDARSLLQTGNLVFHGGSKTCTSLEVLLETQAEERLGLSTAFFVCTAKEWNAVIAQNPFPCEAESDPAHLVVLCLKDAPSPGDVEALQAAIKGPEVTQVDGKHLYAMYPAGIGRSKLTSKLIEDKLRTRATGRNWNTVLKLASLAES